MVYRGISKIPSGYITRLRREIFYILIYLKDFSILLCFKIPVNAIKMSIIWIIPLYVIKYIPQFNILLFFLYDHAYTYIKGLVCEFDAVQQN